MRIASIDIGTNSIRLLLATVIDGRFENAAKEITMTRLGKGVNETQLLLQDRMDDSVEAIKDYVQKSRQFGAEQIYLMATSAVRDAKNAAVFTKAIFDATGLVVEIIPGELEAEIGYLGVSKAVQTNGLMLVIDIGGGSTELIVGDRTGMLYSKSIDVGAVRLSVFSDPLKAEEIVTLQSKVNEALKDVLATLKKYAFTHAIGIGGTAATYTTMVLETEDYQRDVVHGHFVLRDCIKALNEKMSTMTVSERLKIKGLEPRRADIIYAGGVIMETILKALNLEGYTFSDYDNLEGLILLKEKMR